MLNIAKTVQHYYYCYHLMIQDVYIDCMTFITKYNTEHINFFCLNYKTININ